MRAGRGGRELRVNVASILFEYTGGDSALAARGNTVLEALRDLDDRHPGLLFRIVDEQDRLRPHIKVFVDGKLIRNLGESVVDAAELHILQALSGG